MEQNVIRKVTFLHEFGISDKSIEYYNKALNIKSMNGENSEIRSAYRDAVKEDGRNYLALDELGNIARMEGNIQEAGNYYLKSIEVNPDGYDSYNYLIDLYRSEGNKEKMRMYAEILVLKTLPITNVLLQNECMLSLKT